MTLIDKRRLLIDSESRKKQLLSLFNNRDSVAFGEMYEMLYMDIYYFTSSLYRDSEVEPSDIIHDLFVKIWQDKNLIFDKIESVKAYLCICIKNGFKNYLQHQKHVKKYTDIAQVDRDYFTTKIIETETYSVISQAIDLLPSECAKVFKMVLEGWNVDEIAVKLNKAKTTVYDHRKNAVSIIRKKIYNNKMLFLLTFVK